MKPTGLICFGHRGAAGYEKENTIRSVKRALELGAQGVEVDVRLADGQLMVIHDATLKRTTNGSGRVAEKSFEYLRSLDAGSGEPIPTLAEVVEATNRRGIVNIELKGEHAAAPVAELIAAYVQDRGWRYTDFLVSAFDHAQLAEIKRINPAIPIGALVEKAPRDIARISDGLKAWSIHPSRKYVAQKLVETAHRHGLKVLVYTVNEPKDIARMIAMGVDGVFSDYPDRVAGHETGSEEAAVTSRTQPRA